MRVVNERIRMSNYSDYYDRYMALSKEDRMRVMQIENDMSFDGADEITCPYCNSLQHHIEDPDLGYEQDQELQVTCGNDICERKFIINTNVSYSWTTQVPEEEALEIFEKNRNESN